MIDQKKQIIVTMLGVILTGSIQAIILPIIVSEYVSPYFIVLNSSIQMLFGFSIVVFFKYAKYRFQKKENTFLISPTNNLKFVPTSCRYIMFAGITYGISTVAIVYSANPQFTPIVIQAIFSGLGILPSCLLTKFYLKKNVIYHWRYIFLSLILITSSVLLSVIPESKSLDPDSLYWSLIFLFGIICRTMSGIYQEKYFIISDDYSIHNNIINLFYSRISQLLTIGLFFFLGYIFEYPNDHAPDDLNDSFMVFVKFGVPGILLETFIVAYFLVCGFATVLNSISANYNMVACVSINPLTVIFFTIVPSLNSGHNYPIYITLPCMVLSVLSIYFWTKGEVLFVGVDGINKVDL